MKRIRLITGLALTTATLTGAPPATAVDDPIVAGPGCGLDAAEDPNVPGLFRGSVYGGTVYGGSKARPVTGVYLLCTVQVNAPTHAGPDAASVTSWGIGSATMPPTPITYTAGPDDTVSICTEVWVDTGKGHITLFLTEENGELHIDPHADCGNPANVTVIRDLLDLLDARVTTPAPTAHVHAPVLIADTHAITG